MKIYIIHPVRNISENWKDGLTQYVKLLENQGHKVHFPIRDTKQNDRTGLNICQQNKNAIQQADEIHIAWDKKSTGCLFDLGIAFALNKKIVIIIGYFPVPTKDKSFQSMIWAWKAEQNGY